MSKTLLDEDRDLASKYLGGQGMDFKTADKLWRRLEVGDEISLARRVLADLFDCKGIHNSTPSEREDKKKEHSRKLAEWTSKTLELSSSMRHDKALKILRDGFPDLDHASFVVDSNEKREALGIAGGICKRRWMDLGQVDDLRRAEAYYRRGAEGAIGVDGYPHINEAFLKDLLAHEPGASPNVRTEAQKLRAKILKELPPMDQVEHGSRWWNAATRAEAQLGLKSYREVVETLRKAKDEKVYPKASTLQYMVRQFATLVYLQQDDPTDKPFKNSNILKVFQELLPGAEHAGRSALIGKVGLALSGGGFRASFYHLGVLAHLAELDVLRHIEVLSCVSGGSIVGACYWLMLRKRLLTQNSLCHEDYIELVQDLIKHFSQAVGQDLRGQVQPSKLRAFCRFFSGAKGAIDSEETAKLLQQYFYDPLWPENMPLDMHHLSFTPKNHSPALTGSQDFDPDVHNWLREDKVPLLVLNATTVNTGHAWQFTPKGMGESLWSIYPAADSVPRFEMQRYVPDMGWKISLARAVAASACVPGLFEPLRIDDVYDGYEIQLIDGGVHDNQGTMALLAHDCTLLVVSDAAGQLLLEEAPKPGLSGLGAYAVRAMTTLMERVRLANYGDLANRVRTKLIRGLMFLHIKDGLEVDPIRTKFSQDSYTTQWSPLSSLGIRRDFQRAIAELRTDLDVFSDDEAHAVMACGYQMTKERFQTDLQNFSELYENPIPGQWLFADMLKEVGSTETNTPRRQELIHALREGRKRKI